MLEEESKHTISTKKASIRQTFKDKSKKNYTTETSSNLGQEGDCSAASRRQAAWGPNAGSFDECEDADVSEEGLEFKSDWADEARPRGDAKGNIFVKELKLEEKYSAESHSRMETCSEKEFDIDNLVSFKASTKDVNEVNKRLESLNRNNYLLVSIDENFDDPKTEEKGVYGHAAKQPPPRATPNPKEKRPNKPPKPKNFSKLRPRPKLPGKGGVFRPMDPKHPPKNCSAIYTSRAFKSRPNSSSLDRPSQPWRPRFAQRRLAGGSKNVSVRRKMDQVEYMIRKNKYPNSNGTKGLRKFVSKKQSRGGRGALQSTLGRDRAEGRVRVMSKSPPVEADGRYTSVDKGVVACGERLRAKMSQKARVGKIEKPSRNVQKRNLSLNFKFEKSGRKDKKQFESKGGPKGSFRNGVSKRRKMLKAKVIKSGTDQSKGLSRFGRSLKKAKGNFSGLGQRKTVWLRSAKFDAIRGGSPLARKLLQNANK